MRQRPLPQGTLEARQGTKGHRETRGCCCWPSNKTKEWSDSYLSTFFPPHPFMLHSFHPYVQVQLEVQFNLLNGVCQLCTPHLLLDYNLAHMLFDKVHDIREDLVAASVGLKVPAAGPCTSQVRDERIG